MHLKIKLTTTLLGIIVTTACLASPGEKITLNNISMISPGNENTISLSKLSDRKFYKIEAVLQNTNLQDVDYRLTTYYGTNKNGSVGNVIVSNNSLVKDKDGYKGHLNPTDQSIKITIYNVKPDHGIFLSDQIKLENITPVRIGSGIELREVVATEQADSGEGLASSFPPNTGNDGL